MSARIGFIGGSGLYAVPEMEGVEERSVTTPWGDPSETVVRGSIRGRPVAFLARHGRGHRILPSEVNFRANIFSLRSLGCEVIVAFSAVGSLRREIAPLDFVLPSQIIDRTRLRDHTFFGDGIVGHVGFADPFDRALEEVCAGALQACEITCHRDKTLVVMEGPAFSTRAESHLYRSWGADVINMSALPEAKLAREAGVAYQMICMSTDYDCWHEDEDPVTAAMVIARLTANAANARRVIVELVDRLATFENVQALAGRQGVITPRELWPPAAAARLEALWGGET